MCDDSVTFSIQVQKDISETLFLSGILMELVSIILAIWHSNIWIQQRHVEMWICKLFQDLQNQQQAQPINVYLLDKKIWNVCKAALSQNLAT